MMRGDDQQTGWWYSIAILTAMVKDDDSLAIESVKMM